MSQISLICFVQLTIHNQCILKTRLNSQCGKQYLMRKVFDSVRRVVDCLRTKQSFISSLFVDILIRRRDVQTLRNKSAFGNGTLPQTGLNTCLT